MLNPNKWNLKLIVCKIRRIFMAKQIVLSLTLSSPALQQINIPLQGCFLIKILFRVKWRGVWAWLNVWAARPSVRAKLRQSKENLVVFGFVFAFFFFFFCIWLWYTLAYKIMKDLQMQGKKKWECGWTTNNGPNRMRGRQANGPGSVTRNKGVTNLLCEKSVSVVAWVVVCQYACYYLDEVATVNIALKHISYPQA